MNQIKNLKQFSAAIQLNGGATFNINTGEEPTSGTAVALHGHEKIVNFLTESPSEILDIINYSVKGFIKDNAELLAEEDHNIGGWIDSETGKLYLDVVEVIHNRETAIRTAVANRQIAVYDLDNKEEFRIELVEQNCGTITQQESAREASIRTHIRRYENL